MATFQSQVEGITSLSIGTTPTTTELTTYLTEGAKEIINILPEKLQKLCSSIVSFGAVSTVAGSEAETLNTAKIFSVFANNIKCREISSTDKFKAEDSTDILYATTTDPAYYLEANKINVLPGGRTCKYEEVQYPAVAFGDSSISVFPDEAEYLVILYAAMKSIFNVMGNKNASLSALSITAVPPDTPTITEVTFSDITGSTFSSATVTQATFSGDYPSYSSPNVTGDGATLTAASTALSTGQIGVDAEFLEFDQWFTALGEMIEDDEDIELASAQIEKIKSYVQAYNVQMQDSLNTFNENTARFNALFQTAVQNANLDIQEKIQEAQLEQQANLQNSVNNMQAIIGSNSSKLQKFQSETAVYGAEVNTQVQEYQANLQQNLQEYTLNLKKDAMDYDWYFKQYSILKADYVAGVSMLKTGDFPKTESS